MHCQSNHYVDRFESLHRTDENRELTMYDSVHRLKSDNPVQRNEELGVASHDFFGYLSHE